MTVEDKDRVDLTEPGGTAQRKYAGDGSNKTRSSFEDGGTFTTAGGTRTSTGSRDMSESYEDRGQGKAKYTSNYDRTYNSGTMQIHDWGNGNGTYAMRREKTKSTVDTKARYTLTAGGQGETSTREGGKTEVIEEEKAGTNGTIGGYEDHTYRTDPTTGLVVWAERSGSGGGGSQYTYLNKADTTYTGADANTKYDYKEEYTAPWSSVYVFSSGFIANTSQSHAGVITTTAINYDEHDDTGTIDAAGLRHNDGVHHEAEHSSLKEGTVDGQPYRVFTGDESRRHWSDRSAGTQRTIDWLEQTWNEYGNAILDGVQTAVTVASIVAPPGVGTALALANLGVSYARGQEVTAKDVGLALVPAAGGIARAAGGAARALGGAADKVAVAERLIVAGGGAVTAVTGLKAAAGDAEDAYKKFQEGDILAGLQSVGSAALSGLGAVAGLKNAKQLAGRYSPCQERRIFPWTKDQATCFITGTPLLILGGSKPIEVLVPGDRVLSRSELDPEGPIEAKVVEAVFRRSARIIRLRAGGQEVGTTREHPFWVLGREWVPAGEIRVGDVLVGHDGQRTAVDGVVDAGEYAVVYNLRVADHHTYFVGCPEWGFDLWAHNAYQINDKKYRDGYDAIFKKANGKYDRPERYRRGVRDAVWNAAKGADGKVRDPLTGKVMKKSEFWDMGHKPGYEFRKLQEHAEQNNWTRKQFLDKYHDPAHYRPELPSSNRSHRGELLTNEFFGV